jgi:hypothetical protein
MSKMLFIKVYAHRWGYLFDRFIDQDYKEREVAIPDWEFLKLAKKHEHSQQDLARAVWFYGDESAELIRNINIKAKYNERVKEMMK